MFRRAVMVCLMGLFNLTGLCLAQEKEPVNIVPNGSFEKSLASWHWEEWKGYKVPGYLDRDDMHDGAVSFKLTMPDVESSRQLGMPIKGVKPDQDYTLKIALSAKDVSAKGCVVRMLVNAKSKDGKSKPHGWIQVPAGSGVNDLITTGGTHDWKTFTVTIPAKSIVKNVTSVWIMIFHKTANQGIIGIDNVRLLEGAVDQDKKKAHDLNRAQNQNMTYDIADTTVLKPADDDRLVLTAKPEKTLYRVGQLPQMTLKTLPMAGAMLKLKIKDGYGNILHSPKPVAMDMPWTQSIKWPQKQGYFEVIAQAVKGEKVIAEVRRSLGVLTPPASISSEEPWGLWCNGRVDFQELGVRWTRPALYWGLYHADPKTYIEKTLKMIDGNHTRGIRVLMYPKDHPKPHRMTQKVFKDTPEAWADVRAYWTELVTALQGRTDAWGLINEPYRGMWAGTDDLILRYWQMMHDVVKQYDPKTPLIGPSLNVNEPAMMAQYKELLDQGFGQHIDGVELHTYTATAMPEDINWEHNIQQARKITKAAVGDKPIYSTEMGMSMDYDNELYQAQYLARCFVWAKKMKLKMLLWHMYSWPQGNPLSERNFAIFRSDPRKIEPSQPRPAGVAYGAMTRQLSGATFRTELDYLGPSVKAFVFERNGKPMLAIWRMDQRTSTVNLAVSELKITVTDLFGSTKNIIPQDGIVTLTIGPSMQCLAGVGMDYLQAKPLIQTPPTLTLQAGATGQSQLQITNPTEQQATVSLDWIKPSRWQIQNHQAVTLEPHGTKTINVSVTCSSDAAYEQTVLYARAKFNGKMVAPARLPVLVQPRVRIVQVKPAVDLNSFLPMVEVKIQRLDPTLKKVQVQLDQQSQWVKFEHADQVHIGMNAIVSDAAIKLNDFAIRLTDGRRMQDQQEHSLSFVSTPHATKGLVIDGDLSDWSVMPTPTKQQPSVAWRWDKDHLYLAVKALDEKHIQNQRPQTLWRQDSIQIGLSAFDAQDWLRKPIGEMRESNHLELTVGAHQSGDASAYCHATMNRQGYAMGAVTLADLPAAVKIEQGVTCYEVAIPLKMAGFKPVSEGGIVRASVLLNCNDDGEHRSYLQWFSGIGQTKSPDLYGHLIFMPAIAP